MAISDPNASAYGIYTPAYAESLVQQGPNLGANVLRQWALRNHAQAETGQYDLALQRTQRMQAEAQATEQRNALAIAALEQAANLHGEGVGAAYAQAYLPEVSQQPLLASDANQQALTQAQELKARAEGFGSIADAGVIPQPELIGPYLGIQGQAGEEVVQPYMTPDAITDRQRAEDYGWYVRNVEPVNAQARLFSSMRPERITSQTDTGAYVDQNDTPQPSQSRRADELVYPFGTPQGQGADQQLPVLTPEQARTYRSGTRFRGTDGNIYTVP